MASGITGREVIHVAIIGGGIGSLALAHLLEDTSGVRVTIFERDEDASSRNHGYPVGLKTVELKSTGIAVLRTACKAFLPELDTVLNPNQNGLVYTDPNLNLIFQIFADQSKNRMAAWGALRHLLASRMAQNQEGQIGRPGIIYNKRFTEFSTASEGNHLVAHFQDGSKSPPVDILVGADGAWSRMRRKKYPRLEYKSLSLANIVGSLPLAEIFPTAQENASKLYTLLFPDSNGNAIRVVDRVGASMTLFSWEDPAEDMQRHLAWVVTKKSDQAEEMERLTTEFTLSMDMDENQGKEKMDESSLTKDPKTDGVENQGTKTMDERSLIKTNGDKIQGTKRMDERSLTKANWDEIQGTKRIDESSLPKTDGDESQGTKRMDESKITKTDAEVLHSFCLDHVRGAGYAAELIEVVEKTGPQGMINTTRWHAFSLKGMGKSEISELLRADFGTVPLVILGDAAHGSSSRAGSGVNIALEDARDMAACVEKIVASPETKLELLLQYQEAIFQRGSMVIKGCILGISIMTASGWNATIRDLMLRSINVCMKICRMFSSGKK